MSDPLAIGAMIKVSLPGETPWATVISVEPDGSWHGHIDNYLVAERSEAERLAIAQQFGGSEPLPSLHGWKRGDVVRFVCDEDGRWVPGEAQGGRA